MKGCIKLKSGNIPDKFFNAKALAKGTKIEFEHTNKSCIAKQIAKAHLRENPKYYQKLMKAGL